MKPEQREPQKDSRDSGAIPKKGEQVLASDTPAVDSGVNKNFHPRMSQGQEMSACLLGPRIPETPGVLTMTTLQERQHYLSSWRKIFQTNFKQMTIPVSNWKSPEDKHHETILVTDNTKDIPPTHELSEEVEHWLGGVRSRRKMTRVGFTSKSSSGYPF